MCSAKSCRPVCDRRCHFSQGCRSYDQTISECHPYPPVLVDRAQEDEDLEVDGEKDVLSPTEETLDHHRCWRLGECDLGSDGSAVGGEAVLGSQSGAKYVTARRDDAESGRERQSGDDHCRVFFSRPDLVSDRRRRTVIATHEQTNTPSCKHIAPKNPRTLEERKPAANVTRKQSASV